MGVTGLWSILSPVRQHLPLEELQGQKIAVDLSIWIVESQAIKQMHGAVNKPYLRTVFFRISQLLQLGVLPVFVVDGQPPQVKWDCMMKRQQARLGPAVNRGPPRKQTRSHFKAWINECCKMLDCLGIPYVQSSGEAEAMCALLDKEKVVDGCLTDDGDAFLYGARTVYRNFTLDRKDPHVEVYRMDDVESKLGFDRQKMVAIAIMLGCDYLPKGVAGVGRESAVKLITSLSDCDVIQRIRDWPTSRSLAAMEEAASTKKQPHCATCRHPGTAVRHRRSGCALCGSAHDCTPHPASYQCQCDWHTQHKYLEFYATELTIRRKALADPEFPHEKVLQEFLVNRDRVPTKKLLWKPPEISSFHRYMREKLEWPEEYGREKVLPLLSLWTLKRIQYISASDSATSLQMTLYTSSTKPFLRPHSIVKNRVRQGVPCLEIHWHKLSDDDFPAEPFYTTIEREDLFRICYPTIVQDFEEALALKKKPKPKGARGKKKGCDDTAAEAESPMEEENDLVTQLHNLSVQDENPSQQDMHQQMASHVVHRGSMDHLHQMSTSDPVHKESTCDDVHQRITSDSAHQAGRTHHGRDHMVQHTQSSSWSTHSDPPREAVVMDDGDFNDAAPVGISDTILDELEESIMLPLSERLALAARNIPLSANNIHAKPASACLKDPVKDVKVKSTVQKVDTVLENAGSEASSVVHPPLTNDGEFSRLLRHFAGKAALDDVKPACTQPVVDLSRELWGMSATQNFGDDIRISQPIASHISNLTNDEVTVPTAAEDVSVMKASPVCESEVTMRSESSADSVCHWKQISDENDDLYVLDNPAEPQTHASVTEPSVAMTTETQSPVRLADQLGMQKIASTSREDADHRDCPEVMSDTHFDLDTASSVSAHFSYTETVAADDASGSSNTSASVAVGQGAEIREFRTLATSSTTSVVEDAAKTQNSRISEGDDSGGSVSDISTMLDAEETVDPGSVSIQDGKSFRCRVDQRVNRAFQLLTQFSQKKAVPADFHRLNRSDEYVSENEDSPHDQHDSMNCDSLIDLTGNDSMIMTRTIMDHTADHDGEATAVITEEVCMYDHTMNSISENEKQTSSAVRDDITRSHVLETMSNQVQDELSRASSRSVRDSQSSSRTNAKPSRADPDYISPTARLNEMSLFTDSMLDVTPSVSHVSELSAILESDVSCDSPEPAELVVAGNTPHTFDNGEADSCLAKLCDGKMSGTETVSTVSMLCTSESITDAMSTMTDTENGYHGDVDSMRTSDGINTKRSCSRDRIHDSEMSWTVDQSHITRDADRTDNGYEGDMDSTCTIYISNAVSGREVTHSDQTGSTCIAEESTVVSSCISTAESTHTMIGESGETTFVVNAVSGREVTHSDQTGSTCIAEESTVVSSCISTAESTHTMIGESGETTFVVNATQIHGFPEPHSQSKTFVNEENETVLVTANDHHQTKASECSLKKDSLLPRKSNLNDDSTFVCTYLENADQSVHVSPDEATVLVPCINGAPMDSDVCNISGKMHSGLGISSVETTFCCTPVQQNAVPTQEISRPKSAGIQVSDARRQDNVEPPCSGSRSQSSRSQCSSRKSQPDACLSNSHTSNTGSAGALGSVSDGNPAPKTRNSQRCKKRSRSVKSSKKFDHSIFDGLDEDIIISSAPDYCNSPLAKIPSTRHNNHQKLPSNCSRVVDKTAGSNAKPMPEQPGKLTMGPGVVGSQRQAASSVSHNTVEKSTVLAYIDLDTPPLTPAASPKANDKSQPPAHYKPSTNPTDVTKENIPPHQEQNRSVQRSRPNQTGERSIAGSLRNNFDIRCSFLNSTAFQNHSSLTNSQLNSFKVPSSGIIEEKSAASYRSPVHEEPQHVLAPSIHAPQNKDAATLTRSPLSLAERLRSRIVQPKELNILGHLSQKSKYN